MKKNLLTLVMMSFMSIGLFAQSKFTISGTIKDSKSGETLIGAAVRIVELPNIGVTTNEYGFYSLSIPQGTYTVLVSYVGYADKQEKMDVSKNIEKTWDM
jgi:hypothetical protein